jgi:hypothetical protein
MNTKCDTLNLDYRTGDRHATCPSPVTESPRRTEPVRPSVGRGAHFSACPHGAAVCTEWRLREAGLCCECWAGVLERANAVSPWLNAA